MTGPVLSVSDVTVTYSGVVAVDHVCFDVDPGAFIGLIGPNGAGKTTLIDAVSGLVSYSGHVAVGGLGVDRLAAFERSRMGLARTFQAGELFNDMSVLDNVLIGSYKGSFKGAFWEVLRGNRRAAPRHVLDALEIFGLSAQMNDEAGTLSVGHQKLVGVARALASSPRVLLLDEPAAGLDSAESKELGAKLRQLPDVGVAVVLIDHDVDLVWEVCDLVHVLDAGSLIASGTATELRQDLRVREAYLGMAVDQQ